MSFRKKFEKKKIFFIFLSIILFLLFLSVFTRFLSIFESPLTFSLERTSSMHLSSICRQITPKWDIFASVVLSRPPVIAPPMSEVEQRFQKLQKAEERENSLMCDYELKTLQDQKWVVENIEISKKSLKKNYSNPFFLIFCEKIKRKSKCRQVQRTGRKHHNDATRKCTV